MSSLLTTLQTQADAYFASLQAFTAQHGLETFIKPLVDHCSIKMKNSNDYEKTIEEILPLCNHLEYILMNNRRLATATLREPILFGSFGSTTLLEIAEPRPEKVGKDYVGFEHTEIHYSNLEEIKSELMTKGIPFEERENAFHKFLAVKINPKGQELKFTNKRLANILVEERSQNMLTQIK